MSPPARLGQYQLEAELGRGAFGTVYRARHVEVGEDVAIKVLAEHLARDIDHREQFVAEARLLWRLDHDRIARVHAVDGYDVEILGGGTVRVPYFVMQLADAGTLRSVMDDILRTGRLADLGQIVDLGLELAECLTVIHRFGLVHRDLKPTNILFRTLLPHQLIGRTGTGASSTGSRRWMVLADFGLARSVHTVQRTSWGGTIPYTAPETLLRPESIDHRADLFAAGTILYELATGRLAYPGEGDHPEALLLRREAPVPLRELRPDLPLALDDLVRRLLAPDPADRPADPDEVAAILDALPRSQRGSTATVAAPLPPATIVAPPLTLPSAPGSRPGNPAGPPLLLPGLPDEVARLATSLGGSAGESVRASLRRPVVVLAVGADGLVAAVARHAAASGISGPQVVEGTVDAAGAGEAELIVASAADLGAAVEAIGRLEPWRAPVALACLGEPPPGVPADLASFDLDHVAAWVVDVCAAHGGPARASRVALAARGGEGEPGSSLASGSGADLAEQVDRLPGVAAMAALRSDLAARRAPLAGPLRREARRLLLGPSDAQRLGVEPGVPVEVIRAEAESALGRWRTALNVGRVPYAARPLAELVIGEVERIWLGAQPAS